jgi:hypothetical protein
MDNNDESDFENEWLSESNKSSESNEGASSSSADLPTTKAIWLTKKGAIEKDEQRRNLPQQKRTHFIGKDTSTSDLLQAIEVLDIPDVHMRCPYCWCDFSGSGENLCRQPRRLLCGHVYGLSCLLDWFLEYKHNDCPTCRQHFKINRMPDKDHKGDTVTFSAHTSHVLAHADSIMGGASVPEIMGENIGGIDKEHNNDSEK